MVVALRSAIAALGASLAFAPALAAPPTEQVLQVPGFADFLAVDGERVWVTNKGRVERWSKQGKQAEVAMAHPCGAMAIMFGSLWVADCDERTLNRIDLQTAKISAVIRTGIANPQEGELNVVAGAGSVWVASEQKGVIARVDPSTNRVTASIPVQSGSYYLVFGFGSLWAGSAIGLPAHGATNVWRCSTRQDGTSPAASVVGWVTPRRKRGWVIGHLPRQTSCANASAGRLAS